MNLRGLLHHHNLKSKRRSLKYLFIAIFFSIKLFAQDNIDEEIEKVFQSPIDQRRELMNKLKLHIQTLNQDKQFDAIEKLKEHMLQINHNNHDFKKEQEHNIHHNTQERKCMEHKERKK